MLWKKLDLNLKKTIGFNQTKSYYWNYKEFGKLFYKKEYSIKNQNEGFTKGSFQMHLLWPQPCNRSTSSA
ncbi:MAG: hypothetical protein D8M57_05515 [Candidatus Scalindua sp. AMX11]|nr:MAG: hypothetical protein DWQ00_07270 [Candidatus Scalindua sp.]TDE65994.1 MAG: hypothetical protein D8M57_05515 [Candidatus Scalindua sp. AMX11]